MLLTPADVPVARLLPHQPPMRALTELVSWTPSDTECLAVLDARLPAFEDGEFRPVWLLELLAQAMGAGVAFGAITAEAPREAAGFVVGADEFTFTPSPALVPGARVRLLAHADHDIPPAAEYTVRALVDDEEVARGRLRMLVGGAPPPPPPQPAASLAGFQGCEVTAQGQSVHLVVGSGHPYLDGHFPGQPLLPAVGHLRFVEHAAGLVLGRPVRLAALSRARFQDPVRPGDSLDLELQLALPEVRWILRRAGAPCSKGTGQLA